MATKKTLKAKNLESLGARRLAELLIEISARDAAVEDLLGLELAGATGSAKAALEIRKQMADMCQSRTFIDWHGSQSLANELDTLREAIVGHIAEADAIQAFDLMWSFMELADSVFEHCDDSGGAVGNVFRDACKDLGEIAREAKIEPTELAEMSLEAIMNNNYGQYDNLIGILKPALGQQGLERLKQRVIEISNTSATQSANEDPAKNGSSNLGSISKDERDKRYWLGALSMALRDIADAQGDVDGYIAQYDEKTRKLPVIAASIARRLLPAGRAEEALQALDASDRSDAADRRWSDFEWEDARIGALEALGRADEAQQVRWNCFQRYLSEPHLRAYLERLADSGVPEAEEKAFDYAQEFQHRLAALSFFVSWPALDRASRLVVEHAESLDGNYYEVLAPVARVLEPEHPLAATLVLRAMIDFTLSQGKSTRYRYAARDLSKCSRLSNDIKDFRTHETHDAYKERLRREHGRKKSFWNLID